MITKETVFTKDIANKKLNVTRGFDAPIDRVWKAWTESELLDQWWAPKPYKAITKTMDFREGGMWLYLMQGPQGDGSWCKESFRAIHPQQQITNSVSFCDEDGNVNKDFPTMYWNKEFVPTGNATTVNVQITFDTEAAMEAIIKMGFQEGFTAGLSNLDEYLSTQG